MATITPIASARARRPAGTVTPSTPALAPITRTPELALIMALYAELPREYRGLALARVMQMADRCPDCDASQEAGRIAALIAAAYPATKGAGTNA